jgi:hypothetical protein
MRRMVSHSSLTARMGAAEMARFSMIFRTYTGNAYV